MPIELRILGGARTGHTQSFDKNVIAVGRHPMCDFRFDANKDLDVSTRHGEIRFVDGRYLIHDTKSTNGTFVNGERVEPDRPRELHDDDIIGFGRNGPTVAVRITGVTVDRAARPSSSETPAASSTPMRTPDVLVRTAASGDLQRASTGERIAVAVRRQTRTLRAGVALAVVLLGGFAGVVYYRGAKQTAESRALIDRLIAENEQTRRDLEEKLKEDTAAASALRQRNDSLLRVIRDARGAQQAAAAESLRRDNALQRKFSEMNPAAIARANERAVALITSQIDGKSIEASGFVVSSSGLVMTNRHVVVDETGAHATNIFVRLANNSGTHRAHVVRFATDSLVDLALIQIEGKGPFSAVRGIAKSVDAATGDALVTLGYPFGTDLPMGGTSVEPTLTMGVIGRSIPNLLQVDQSFASHGASGSPVFDAHGHVIGVVWGGPRDSGGRIVYAVPADRITELIKGSK